MLTALQRQTYNFIRDSIMSTGKAPTYRRISDEMGKDISVSYNSVSRICERGWLTRRNGRLALVNGVGQPTTTDEFDYFTVDYSRLTKSGWPIMTDIGG